MPMPSPGLLLGALLGALAGDASAEVPRVAADVAPVHSLAARVMQGLGEPALIVPPGGSPHDHAMRPSEAAALQEADAVIWVGAALTPWLGRAIDRLAGDALVLPLLEVEGTARLGYREGAVFAEAGSDGGEGGTAEGGGPEGALDPHAWLDPGNAALWLDAIAEALAGLDPENAEAYRANAQGGRAEIAAAAAEAERLLAPVRGRPFVVSHDAYHHFEDRFGVPALGAIAAGDAAPPSPARLRAIRDAAAERGAVCVLSEPRSDPGLVEAVTGGSGVRAVADPLGVGLDPGPALYPSLLRELARTLAGCLSGGG